MRSDYISDFLMGRDYNYTVQMCFIDAFPYITKDGERKK